MPSVDPAPVAIDYSQYLSYESRNRVRSQLKQLRPYFDIPGMISFGGGYPHASTWPVNGMTLSIPFANKSVFVPGFGNSSEKALLPLEPYQAPLKTESLRPDLANELQYSATYGHPHYVQWMKEHVERLHAPPYADWNIHATAGNTDGVDAIMRSCLDRGDYFLVEEFGYPGTLTAAQSMGMKPLGVTMDQDGVQAEALEKVLSEWNEEERGGSRPKFFILVPTCSNPTGATMPVYRKKEIYSVCRKWGVLIVEDDPYCYLQMRENGYETPIVPSFLSLDVDGRVLRVDSFSKIVAPGSRSGWITGPAPLIEKIMNSREGSTQAPSGFTVAAISSVLRAWGGHEGFERNYLPHISALYGRRCNTLLDLLKKYLPASTVEFPPPSGGMFLWIRIKVESHPSFPQLSPEEISHKVFLSLIDNLVLVSPSTYFKAPGGPAWSKEEEAKRIYLRLSFSLPTDDEMEEGAKRMAAGLRKEWQLE